MATVFGDATSLRDLLEVGVGQSGQLDYFVVARADGRMVRADVSAVKDRIVGTRWKSLSFPATRGMVSATHPALDTDIPGLLFQNTATNYAYLQASMPLDWVPGTALKPYFHWSKTTSAEGGVHWEMAYRWGRAGALVASSWTTIGSAVPLVSDEDTANHGAVTKVTDIAGTGRQVGDTLFIRLGRVHTLPADDLYAASARLHEFSLRIQVDGIGSADPLVKA
jgi:hypothetical protein